MIIDDAGCYAAIRSKDRRFDGWFFVGVTTTGIFCRPSCPATTPRRRNVRFYPTAAAAQGAGFRACRRCRPDTAPGSPEWNVRGDLASRAMRLIDDGLVDREGVGGVARRLAVSERHLHRVLVQELGAAPLPLARSRRAQTARVLIETTELPFTEIAFAAGFASIRQFNDTVREFFGASPTVLRSDRTTSIKRGRSGAHVRHDGAGPTPISLRLATRTPFAGDEVVGFLAARAIPGVEAVDPDGTYHRVLRLPTGMAIVTLRAQPDHVTADLLLADLRDLGPAVARCRRLLDLDADPEAVDAALGADPVLRPLVVSVPGRRSPGAADGTELLVRAVIGQQVSVAGARTVAGRVATALGEDLPPVLRAASSAGDRLERAFPAAATLAAADPTSFSMPRARGLALTEACGLVADASVVLDPGSDREEVEQRLLAVKGIGPWTTAYIAMRALSDPDVFLPTDLGVLRGLGNLAGPTEPKHAAALAERWRPWRSYALHHLWPASAPQPPGATGLASASTSMSQDA
ncbi:MAG: transcriptional regulator, AraC family [Ilumatobacteraceae bacterium]|nr:transcriptional regulator, AraC family [Ilumatobacteraceae bacterium]